jgi:hypothetical protein
MFVPTKFEFSFCVCFLLVFVHMFVRACLRIRKYLHVVCLLGLAFGGRFPGAGLGCHDLNVFLGRVSSYGKGRYNLTD